MDVNQFWQLIEASRADLDASDADDECDAQADNLKALLRALSAQEIAGFERIFDQLDAAAYRWDLWAAAYIINGGASDDGFTYFRWWLIAQGQSYYEAALENVEEAGDNAKFEGAECEEIRYCINEAYREKTGKDGSDETDDANFPDEPIGKAWQEEELPKLYPRLSEKFG